MDIQLHNDFGVILHNKKAVQKPYVNMSKRASLSLKEDMEFMGSMGSIRLGDVEESQKKSIVLHYGNWFLKHRLEIQELTKYK